MDCFNPLLFSSLEEHLIEPFHFLFWGSLEQAVDLLLSSISSKEELAKRSASSMLASFRQTSLYRRNSVECRHLRCLHLLLLEVGEDKEAVVPGWKCGIVLSSVGGTVGRH